MQKHTSKILIWCFLMILSLINDENPHVWDLITTPPWLETRETPRFSGQNYTCWWVIFLPSAGPAHNTSRGASRGQEAECWPEPQDKALLWWECIQVLLSAMFCKLLTCRHNPGWPSSSTTWSMSRCCPAQWATGARRSGWGGRRTKSGSTGQYVHIMFWGT